MHEYTKAVKFWEHNIMKFIIKKPDFSVQVYTVLHS